MSQNDKNLSNDDNDDKAKPLMKPEPKRWWQWLLVYPGLAVAVVGAIPTYVGLVKSFLYNVPISQVPDASQQTELWNRNLDCVRKSSFTTVVNENNIEIGSIVCKSGDILLQGKRPQWPTPRMRWLAWSEVAPDDLKDKNAQFEIIGSAHAKEVASNDLKNKLAQLELIGPAHDKDAAHIVLLANAVMCQRWVGPGQLLQRVGTPAGCFDQVINTYNGWILSSQPAPCVPSC